MLSSLAVPLDSSGMLSWSGPTGPGVEGDFLSNLKLSKICEALETMEPILCLFPLLSER